jgi:peptide/nickel transport system substrate-binding protein
MRGLRRLGAVALVAVVAAACGSSSDDAGSPGTSGVPAGGDDVCTPDRAGGTATMGVYSEIQGLDPLGPPDKAANGGTELAAIFDTLVTWDAGTGDWHPQVAESLEPNADGTAWTLTLRPGIRFGNGDPLTSEAVAWTIDLHQSDENKQTTKALALMIDEVEVVDDLTMVLHLSQPWGDFPYVLASDIGMVINPAVRQAMTPEAFALDPGGAGVGAFEVASYAPGEGLVLRAKADYWDGPVCLDELRFVNIKGAAATYEAFEAGEVQVAFLREPLVIAEARDAGVEGFSNYHNLGEMLLMNTATGPLADVRLRQAIAAAIDVEAVDQRANEGTAPASGTVISPEDALLDPGVDGPTVDAARAAALVQEVKDDTGWDGTVRLACDNAPVRVETALAVEALLEQAGFEVALANSQPVSETVKQVITDRDFDLACWGLAPAQNLWPTFDRYFRSDSSGNVGGVDDAAVDAAIEELRLAGSAEETRSALADLQEAWNAVVPAQPLWAVEEFIAVAPELHGVTLDRTTVVRFEHAYLAP